LPWQGGSGYFCLSNELVYLEHVITLTLLHPVQSTPVQSWSFEHDPVIRIGRAVDNHVVLYSAVVSRYHVEVRLTDDRWEVVNLGTNGTYVDGKRVNQAPLVSGGIMRLARSGPNIQISIEGQSSGLGDESLPSAEAFTIEEDEPDRADLSSVSSPEVVREPLLEEAEPVLLEEEPLAAKSIEIPSVEVSPFYVGGRYPLFNQGNNESAVLQSSHCDHQRSPGNSLICIDCGFPIHPIKTVGRYQVLKSLNPAGNSLLAWRDGHTVVLKTLPLKGLNNPELVQQFEDRCRLLCQLEHPGMPKVFEAFEQDGQPYLVSEMIYGSTLREWMAQQGPIPRYQAVQWVLEVSRLLDYLHKQAPPYIHRRIQPSNLIRPKMSHGSSQVVLVDFGELRGLTVESETYDSVVYIAPEQQVGEDGPLSDLYALGVTLLNLLTAQEPDAFYQLGDDEFRLQVKDVPSIGPDVAEIIQKLTHLQPAQRFESAAAVAEALQQLL
jgi:eukaryotic-like serine/threonine-protein kinase